MGGRSQCRPEPGRCARRRHPEEGPRPMAPRSQARTAYPRIRLAYFNKLINLAMSRQFQLRGLDVTREQEAILRELAQLDGCNQADLAQRTGQDRNNLSRTLGLLEAKQLVRRDVSPEDKRHSVVRLTPAGRRMQQQALQAVDAYRDALYAGFTTQEIDDFARTVSRLTTNLESFLAASGPTPREPDDTAHAQTRHLR
jgi:DNA-binding MarR family transcriptional regulator